MKNEIILNAKQIAEIKKQADITRKEMGVFADVSVADDLLFFLEKKGIVVCEYPFDDVVEIYANITIFNSNDEPLVFIGLNSNIYFDEQIFALAHELYHYQTKTGLAYQKGQEKEEALIERMADRYAAELLLPGHVLQNIVAATFEDQDINEVSELRILRFIAKLQIDWWLPFRSVVLRLFEDGGLSVSRRDELFKVDCRDFEGNYAKIFKSMDSEVFLLLNNKSGEINITKSVLETILRNFEDGYISETELFDILKLYGRSPSDFGIDFAIEEEDDES